MGRVSDFITRNARRKLQGQISDILSSTEINGLSFTKVDTLLSYVPTDEEFKQYFEMLCQKVDFFIQNQTDFELKEISKSEINIYEKVIAVKVYVTNDWDFYSVANIAFYLKEGERGWRMLLKKDWFDKSPPNYHKEYPESIVMGYCGCGGDVNRAYESDAIYKTERFFVFGKENPQEYEKNKDSNYGCEKENLNSNNIYDEADKEQQQRSLLLSNDSQKRYFVWEEKKNKENCY